MACQKIWKNQTTMENLFDVAQTSKGRNHAATSKTEMSTSGRADFSTKTTFQRC